jgi:nitronate monooxygenase
MPHRVLANETVERWDRAGRPPAGERPGEDDVVATRNGDPIERYDEALATPDVSGTVGAMALFAGQSAGLVDEDRAAGAVVETLVTETKDAISGLPGCT